MSPALNRSSAIWRFEGNEAIKIRDGITFDFYTSVTDPYNISVPYLYSISAAQICIYNLYATCIFPGL